VAGLGAGVAVREEETKTQTMKTGIFVVAFGLLLFGYTLPETNGLAELSAVCLVMALLWFLITKQGPKERREAQEHTERIVDNICDEFRHTRLQQHEDMVRLSEHITDLAERR